MLQKTSGVFIHQLKYSESSIIARIYTENSGLKSFLIKGVRNKKSVIKANVLQPLALLDLVFLYKEKSTLHYLKELNISNPGSSIPFNFYKSAIAIFMSEVLLKCIKEEETNPALFAFISNTIKLLDIKEDNLGFFPILFMIKLSRYLGFSIEDRVNSVDLIMNYGSVSQDVINFLQHIKSLTFDDLNQLKLSKSTRKEVLGFLIKYYEVHLIKSGDIKSHKVLETIM
ncbi:MAG: DNA repair protein RecO [Bacteroidota bacterium]|nr:DNA repair protein RecO [Bacteroidota bacterium]